MRMRTNPIHRHVFLYLFARFNWNNGPLLFMLFFSPNSLYIWANPKIELTHKKANHFLDNTHTRTHFWKQRQLTNNQLIIVLYTTGCANRTTLVVARWTSAQQCFKCLFVSQQQQQQMQFLVWLVIITSSGHRSTPLLNVDDAMKTTRNNNNNQRNSMNEWW